MRGMDSSEIRYRNTRALVASAGGVSGFAEKLGKSQPHVSSFAGEKPIKGIGSKIARQIEVAFGKPAGWLDLPHPNEWGDLRGVELGQISSWKTGTPLDPDEVEVPLFKEVEMSAGPGAAHTVETNGRKVRFSLATLRACGVDPDNAACATIRGNSMESLILDGSTIGIDRGRTQVLDGELYAIDHDGMLRVKYLYRTPGGGLRLRSENRDEHPDEHLSAADAGKIRILGWVFWWSTVRKWRGR